MRLLTIGTTMFLAAASVGMAHASLVQNGDFSSTNGVSVPTQFGTGSKNGFTATQFITGWTGNNGLANWYPNAHDASRVEVYGEFGKGSTHNTGKAKLYPSVTAPPSTTAFVSLNGDQRDTVQASISQTLAGLVIGDSYNVSFNWGGTQMQSRTGPTTEHLQVSLGGDSQNTQTLNNPSGAFTGWQSETFSFVADSASAALKFLSVGTPHGAPPVALLTNVSVTHAVPEPSSLALLGGGLLGLGLLSRRRTIGPRGARSHKS